MKRYAAFVLGSLVSFFLVMASALTLSGTIISKATPTTPETLEPILVTDTTNSEGVTDPTITEVTDLTPVELTVIPIVAVFDHGGENVRPIWLNNLDGICEDLSSATNAIDEMMDILENSNISAADANQVATNTALILSRFGKDDGALEALGALAHEAFHIVQDDFTMDELHAWATVCDPNVIHDYFSGEFSEAPTPDVIDTLRSHIHNLMNIPRIADAPGIKEAIASHGWFSDMIE